MNDVAIVHDHLLHRGGSERLLLSMHKAFPSAPIYTAFFDATRTYPEFAQLDVRELPIGRIVPLRRRHKWAFPVLAPAFSRLHLKSNYVLCSSSGWAHGAVAQGRKVVYCHSPANWLYRAKHYVRKDDVVARQVLRVLGPRLERWDRNAAATADLYIANSREVASRIRSIYGITARVLHPPPTLDSEGEQVRLPISGGFLLSVSRMVPHKNLDAIIAAFSQLPSERLVVVGDGPERKRLERAAPKNVMFLGVIDESKLRWLYDNCVALVAASHEDFGLTPLEAAAFGKPSVVLQWGGFLDSVTPRTGIFFDEPSPQAIVEAISRLRQRSFSASDLREHAATFSEETFVTRLRDLVLEPNREDQ